MNALFLDRLRKNDRRGMTLVEVLLSAAILGILAVVVINALFYPRLLMVSSTLKQSAIQAAAGEIERLRANYSYALMPASGTTNLTARYNLTVQEFTSVNAPGYATPYKYKRITVSVSYGNTNLTLTSYRSP